jgi:predicted TIM-barrel fold metal-dependent hydrolase
MNGSVIDMHVHVGLRGDTWPQWGKFSDEYASSIPVAVLLLYGRLKREDLTDVRMRAATEQAISECQKVDQVVCLALDPAFDESGQSLAEQSHMWVANEYVIDLRKSLPNKVLFGASVHPYDPTFKARVKACVDQGAVLLKWLPSAQGINLADQRVGEALQFLATVGPGGRPLPLLLHVGSEFNIPPIDRRMHSFDFLSWSMADRIWNWFRGSRKWIRPDVERIHEHLRAGLDAGAVIILAHCGTPYFASGVLGKLVEHSDFDVVREYLETPAYQGKMFADVSAMVTPFRQSYFPAIQNLPPASLVFGSDFPVVIFELSADLQENLKDLKAVLDGHIENIVVPDGNLIDVNYRELRNVFGDHPMFTNFAALMPPA